MNTDNMYKKEMLRKNRMVKNIFIVGSGKRNII